MSELRVIHLLEGLCSGMVKYEMVAEDETHPAHWARTGASLLQQVCCQPGI